MQSFSGDPNISQDGKWITFVAEESQKFNLYVQNRTSEYPRKIFSDSSRMGIASPCFTPSADQILYGQIRGKDSADIFAIQSVGGTPRLLIRGGLGPAVSPGGRWIALFRARYGELWVTDADGKNERKLAHFSPSVRGNVAAWSSHGERLAFLRQFVPTDGERYCEVFVRSVDDSTETQVTFDKKNINDLCWYSESQIIVSTNKGGEQDLWLAPVGGGASIQMTYGPGAKVVPRISNDRRYLVYRLQIATSNLWTADLLGKGIQQLTSTEDFVGFPAFSPDGSKILYAGFEPPTYEKESLVIANANGSDPQKVSLDIKGYHQGEVWRWARNGKSFWFDAEENGSQSRHEMFEYDLATGKCSMRGPGKLLDLSLDGKYILYQPDVKSDTIVLATIDSLRTIIEKGPIPLSIPPRFTHDSRTVIAQVNNDILLYSIEKKKYQFIRVKGSFNFICPMNDGRTLLGASFDPRSSKNYLATLPMNGGTPTLLIPMSRTSDLGFWSGWHSSLSPDGSIFAFSVTQVKNMVVLQESLP